MAVAADDDVYTLNGRGDLLVALIAHMREHDDLVDALALEIGDRLLEVFDLVLEGDLVAGRGGLVGIGGENGDDGDLLAAQVLDDVGVVLAGQDASLCGDGVSGDDREFGRLDELEQFLRSVVEFVVADRHGVEAHAVHEVGDRSALEHAVEQRALELVAGVKDQHVLALQLAAAGVDRGLHAGDAAEALVLRRFLVRAG